MLLLDELILFLHPDMTDSLPNDAALTTVTELIQCGIDNGSISPDFGIMGHRQDKDTECPGDALFGWVQSWPNWDPNPIP